MRHSNKKRDNVAKSRPGSNTDGMIDFSLEHLPWQSMLLAASTCPRGQKQATVPLVPF